jgi:biopolymer transport protein ExbD
MSRKKSRMEEAGELDLVPIMNMVTILIPFLLMAAQFVSLAVIDSTLPAIGAPTPPEEEPEKPPLNLSIIITDEGYTVAGADAVLNPEGSGEAEEVVEGDEGEEKGPTVPCKEAGCPTPESYDTAELVRLLNLIKDEYPLDENVILVPEPRIAYEVLVITMDNTREDYENMVDGSPRLLFPFVVIAGGVE